MKFGAAFLAVALIARNNLFFSGPFEFLRGLALLMVAVIGFYKVFQPSFLQVSGRYWPLIGYSFATFCSLATTDYPAYVGFQTLSLMSVIVFSMAYNESKNEQRVNFLVFNVTFIGYLLFIIISLGLYTVRPSLVQEVLYAGELRFRGIFPKSGIMGASAGVLAGLCLFWKNKPVWLRTGAFICAAVCVLLTQSRTFWVAVFVASLSTYAIYFRYGIRIIFGVAIISGILIAGIYFAGVKITGDSFKKFARVESIQNLTGRVELWNDVFVKLNDHPIFGLGLTAGSSAFIDRKNIMGFQGNDEDELNASRGIGKTTMHSGYMQSLLDAGAFGTFFYVNMILVSLWRMYRRDVLRQYPAEFYLLVFLSVANISENVIYAVTVFNSVLFFMLAAFAMHLQHPGTVCKQTRRRPLSVPVTKHLASGEVT